VKYRIDLHCHSRFSSDGVSEPEEMVQAAKERGLHGFAITDHNTSACVDYFLSAGLMREDGQPVDGFLILPGQEITTSAGHLLALGVRLPDLKGIPPNEAMNLIQSAGGPYLPIPMIIFGRESGSRFSGNCPWKRLRFLMRRSHSNGRTNDHMTMPANESWR